MLRLLVAPSRQVAPVAHMSPDWSVGEVMLGTFLTLFSSVMFPTMAIVWLRRTEAAPADYVVALIASILLAGSNMWAISRIAAVCEARLAGGSIDRQKWVLRILYGAAILWVLLAGLLSAAVTEGIHRLLV